MVRGMYKSRTFRRVYVKTPGGRVALHHVKRKPASAQCGNCGAVLKGVPRARTFEIVNMPKTQRRPQRPFGGVLCSKCSREVIRERAIQA